MAHAHEGRLPFSPRQFTQRTLHRQPPDRAQIVAASEAMPQNRPSAHLSAPITRSIQRVPAVEEAVKATSHSDWVTRGGMSLRNRHDVMRVRPRRWPTTFGASRVLSRPLTARATSRSTSAPPAPRRHVAGHSPCDRQNSSAVPLPVTKMTLTRPSRPSGGDDRSWVPRPQRVHVRAHWRCRPSRRHPPAGHVNSSATLSRCAGRDRLVRPPRRGMAPIKAVRVGSQRQACSVGANPQAHTCGALRRQRQETRRYVSCGRSSKRTEPCGRPGHLRAGATYAC